MQNTIRKNVYKFETTPIWWQEPRDALNQSKVDFVCRYCLYEMTVIVTSFNAIYRRVELIDTFLSFPV